MQDFTKLAVWKKSHELTLQVYRITKEFPSDERYGLSSQMRRSASAIPTNIAEGCGRSTSKDLARFLDIAMGSASELHYQIILSSDLDFISAEIHQELILKTTEVKRMLGGFIRSIRD